MAYPVEPAPVRVPKTAELVARHIRGQIVRGELQEGDSLSSESALMEHFAISRPTLREAFRILEHEGLIIVRRGARGGARVQVPDSDVAARHAGLVLQYRQATLADVFEARTIVEPPAAAMLAARRDRVAISRKLAKAVASERSTAPASWQDPVFHRLVVSLTGNETLTLLTNMLEYISEAAGRESDRIKPPTTHEVEQAHRAHDRLVDLIRAGDADGAERHWRLHLVEVAAVLQRLQGSRATVLEVLGA